MPNKGKIDSLNGFVGLSSLLGVTFLLIATVIGVTVVTNRNITLNPNKEAAIYPTATTTSAPTPTTNCIGEGGTIAAGTPECCRGLVKSDCVATGSFSYCYCKKLVSSTPTPSSKNCDVKNCSGTSCVSTSTTVPYSQSCPTSNCVSDNECGARLITPTPAPTPTPSTNTGCSCTNGKYAGSCGHSTGYPCSTASNVCETTSCTSSCAKTQGYTGSCGSGICICNSPKPTPQSQPGTMFSGYSYTSLPGIYNTTQPSEEYIKGTTACMEDPDSTECKEWNQQLTTEAAIVAATLILTPLAVPEIGAAAYAYGTASLATLPASVQVAAAITGTVAGLAGVGAGTYACATNPYSDACVSYIAAIQGDPIAMIQLANSADGLINVSKTIKTSVSPPATVVYRGVRSSDPDSAYNQLSNMLRSNPNNGESLMDPTNLNLSVQSSRDFQNAVINLGNNPTEDNFRIVINRAVNVAQKEELESTLKIIKYNQQLLNVSFEDSLMRTHIDSIRGALNTSPYVSATTSLDEALGYISSGGSLVVSKIPNTRISPVIGLQDTEVAVHGLIMPEEVIGFIPTTNLTPQQIQDAVYIMLNP